MEKTFKTNAKCAGCVAKIGEKLSQNPAVNQWSVDLTSPERILHIDTTLSDEEVTALVAEAGFKAEKR